MKIYGDEGECMTKTRFEQLSELLKKAINGGVSRQEIETTAKQHTYGGMLPIPKRGGDESWQRKR